MGTAVAANDILSIRSWNVLGSQAAVNSFNWQCISVSGGGITDQDFSDAHNTTYATLHKNSMPDSAVHRGIQCYFLSRGGAFLPQPVKSIGAAGDGTIGTTAVPKNTCAILKYASAIRGPGGRGRVFLPFISADYVDATGLPAAGLAVLLNSFASFLLTPMVVTVGANSATFVFGIVARHPAPNLPTFLQAVTCEGAEKFGQMHKRGDYGRPNNSPI